MKYDIQDIIDRIASDENTSDLISPKELHELTYNPKYKKKIHQAKIIARRYLFEQLFCHLNRFNENNTKENKTTLKNYMIGLDTICKNDPILPYMTLETVRPFDSDYYKKIDTFGIQEIKQIPEDMVYFKEGNSDEKQ